MHHGSRHRRSDRGRSRHERRPAGGSAPAVGLRRLTRPRAAKAVGAAVAVSLVAGIGAVVTAGAASTDGAPGQLVVSAAADTYVYEEYPTASRGDATKLTASNQEAPHTRSYLRFAVRGVPAEAEDLTAHLRFSSDRNQ